jgi:hypothetical protein
MSLHASSSASGLSSSALRRHPASLTPKAVHNPALLDLVKCPVSRDMVGESS